MVCMSLLFGNAWPFIKYQLLSPGPALVGVKVVTVPPYLLSPHYVWQTTNHMIHTSCPERMTSTRCHDGSVFNFWLTKYLSCSCSLLMKSVPGVMQLESKRGSEGRTFPFCSAFLMRSCASLAERNLLPCCWFILARGATPSTARKRTLWGLMMRNRLWGRRGGEGKGEGRVLCVNGDGRDKPKGCVRVLSTNHAGIISPLSSPLYRHPLLLPF